MLIWFYFVSIKLVWAENNYFLSSSRPAKLPGRQPPGVARTGGGDVLLVASDSRAHHALQTQPVLPDPEQQQLS